MLGIMHARDMSGKLRSLEEKKEREENISDTGVGYSVVSAVFDTSHCSIYIYMHVSSSIECSRRKLTIGDCTR